MTLAFMNYFYYAPYMSGLGLLSMYFIEKYNLTRCYRKPEQINGEISFQYLNLIKLGLIIFCVVGYILNNKLLGEIGNTLIFFLVLAVIVSPYQKFLSSLICFEGISSNHSYHDKFFSFGMNYEMINPVTKVSGYYKYLNKMLDSGIISQSEKQDFLSGKGGEEVSNIIELYYSKVNLKQSSNQNARNSRLRSLSVIKQRNSMRKSRVYPSSLNIQS